MLTRIAATAERAAGMAEAAVAARSPASRRPAPLRAMEALVRMTLRTVEILVRRLDEDAATAAATASSMGRAILASLRASHLAIRQLTGRRPPSGSEQRRAVALAGLDRAACAR